jgi:hypothetical protein
MKYLLLLLSFSLVGCSFLEERPFTASYCYVESPKPDGTVMCEWNQTIYLKKQIPKSRMIKEFINPKSKYVNKNGSAANNYVGKVNKNTDFHGQGKMTFNSGNSYEGIWENGKLNEGTLIIKNTHGFWGIPSDSKYEGTFNKVKTPAGHNPGWSPNGKGKLTMKYKMGTHLGGTYVGEFVNGYAVGQGTRSYIMTFDGVDTPAGKVVGTWKSSIMNGTSAIWDAEILNTDGSFSYRCKEGVVVLSGNNLHKVSTLCGTLHEDERSWSNKFIQKD